MPSTWHPLLPPAPHTPPPLPDPIPPIRSSAHCSRGDEIRGSGRVTRPVVELSGPRTAPTHPRDQPTSLGERARTPLTTAGREKQRTHGRQSATIPSSIKLLPPPLAARPGPYENLHSLLLILFLYMTRHPHSLHRIGSRALISLSDAQSIAPSEERRR